MKPLYLTQAWISQEYDGDVGLEIVDKGKEIAFFITRDTPIVITPYSASGLRKLIGDACHVCTSTTQHGVRVVGSVDEIAGKITDYLEWSQ